MKFSLEKAERNPVLVMVVRECALSPGPDIVAVNSLQPLASASQTDSPACGEELSVFLIDSHQPSFQDWHKAAYGFLNVWENSGQLSRSTRELRTTIRVASKTY